MDDEGGPIVARVQRADCSESVIVLEVRVPGRTSVVIVGAPRSGARPAAGLLTKETRQEIWGGRLPPSGGRVKAREDALEGAAVLAIGDADLAIEQKGDARVIRAHGGRVAITDEDRSKAERVAFVGASDAQRAAWEERGVALARALADDAIEVHRSDLVKMLEKARSKIERRREAVRADLAKIAQADKIAEQAQWLVGEAARTPRGAAKMIVTDWSSGEAVPMEIPLDPAKSAREQVEAMFKRAKRLRLGGRIAGDRLTQAETQLEGVTHALDEVKAAPSLAAMDDAAREAKRIAPRDVALPQAAGGGATGERRGDKKGDARRTPFRTFLARSGAKILVGKGAADNDALTLHVAKPHDLWLHAKDKTGAHVIVPLAKGHTCPGDDLVDAAHLAAHFSDARDESIVDIQYTPKRYLRKPKGSGPGFVIVDREKVLALRVVREVISALLEREEA
ncbi:MAG: DUF814 domain-containing protein [Deltaproteobacteria bacterium]|nr:DUF814 domain-containing protein [Deltaproteobacteria bacterium]